MKKSDLKTGMRVTTRDERQYIILLDAEQAYSGDRDIMVDPEDNSHNWNLLLYYTEDLLCKTRKDSEFDIMRVEIPKHPYDIFYDYSGFKLLWERIEEEEVEPDEDAILVEIMSDLIDTKFKHLNLQYKYNLVCKSLASRLGITVDDVKEAAEETAEEFGHGIV